jgi:hypothetical protein
MSEAHAADPRDTRDTREMPVDIAFRFPDNARTGQVITSTFGKAYQFDGRQWREVAAPTGTPVTYGTGLTQVGDTVNLDAATDAIIGGVMEAPPDGQLYGRVNTGGVGGYAVVPAAPAAMPLPPADGLTYGCVNTGGVITWVVIP